LIGWFWRWGPVAAQMAAIFFASSLTAVPSLPAGLSNYTGHLVGYAVLGALAVRGFAGAAWAGVTPGAVWRAVLLASAYGVTDEWHQVFVPNRFAGADDCLADTAGALVGALAVLAAARALARRRP
jgi:VanZ family protein